MEDQVGRSRRPKITRMQKSYLPSILSCIPCSSSRKIGTTKDNKNAKKLQVEEGYKRKDFKYMAMAGAEAEILRVIEELNSFLIHEDPKSLYESLREKVERVIRELRLFLDFLLEKKLEEGSRLKYWACDMVEIAQHALYIINDRDPWNYSEMASYLRPICRALSDTRRHIVQLRVQGGEKSPITSSSPEEGDEYVVDLEEDVKSMIHKWEPNSGYVRLYTVCIVGMAGIGKTTLARKVYNHPTTVAQFEPRVWVHVSGEWSNKELLMKLALQVLRDKDQSVLLEEIENADNRTLEEMLRQHLKGKNFFIVLDNIGKLPYCGSIFKALPKEGIQSRLLLTSRFQSLKYRLQTYAEDSNLEMKPLEMKPLDDDWSWHLFTKLLLFNNQEFPKKLVMKGKEMLRSCNGLPLSIKEVATQFVKKRQRGSEWEELLESPDLSATLAVLESIYQRWPPQLRSNFLCLSFFKKYLPIRIEKLVQVWSTAQVIPYEGHDDKDLEDKEEAKLNMDTLEGYKMTLIKLTDESVVEVDRSKKNELIKCIHINASFHTLSTAKAEEEMVFEILKKGKGNPPSSREPCHRAIYCSRDEFNHVTDHDERLVSLFFRGGGYFDASEPHWESFKQLRTLDFEGFGLKMLPKTIGVLTELRYLGLRDNYIQELPQSLGRLKNLEVLDIALNFSVEVPSTIQKLSSLHHLYMSNTTCRKPLKTHALKNLKTLTYISLDNWAYTASSLKMMTSLHKLGIEVDENSDVSKLFTSLANLKNLCCLILRGFRFRSLPSLHGLKTLCYLREIILDGLLTKLPSTDTFPPGMTHLSLINSCLVEDPMPQLGKLIPLKYLKLKNAYTGQEMVIISSNSIFSLKVLCLEELWHLRNIRIEKYLELVKLEIKNCPYLESILKTVINIYNTKEVKMLTTRKHAAKIRKSKFLSKIKHVDIQP